jgi:hypothetical protein
MKSDSSFKFHGFWFSKLIYSLSKHSFSTSTRDDWMMILNPGKLTRDIIQRMDSEDGFKYLRNRFTVSLISIFGKAGTILHMQSRILSESKGIVAGESVNQPFTEATVGNGFINLPIDIDTSGMSVDDILKDLHVFVKSICFNPQSTSFESLDRFIVRPSPYKPEIVVAIIKVYCQCGRIEQPLTMAENVDSLFGLKTDSLYYVPVFRSFLANGNIMEAERLLAKFLMETICI